MEPNGGFTSVPTSKLADDEIDFTQLNSDRLDRRQSVMREEAVPACLFFHPANIRYATGTAVMDVHTLGASERYCLVPANGDPVLFEWDMAISQSRKLVRDVRPALWWQYQGKRGDVLIARFAPQIRDALNELGVASGDPVGIDRADTMAVFALQNAGVNLISASKVTDRAREIKTPWEVALMRNRVMAAWFTAWVCRMRDLYFITRVGVTILRMSISKRIWSCVLKHMSDASVERVVSNLRIRFWWASLERKSLWTIRMTSTYSGNDPLPPWVENRLPAPWRMTSVKHPKPAAMGPSELEW